MQAVSARSASSADEPFVSPHGKTFSVAIGVLQVGSVDLREPAVRHPALKEAARSSASSTETLHTIVTKPLHDSVAEGSKFHMLRRVLLHEIVTSYIVCRMPS